MFFYKKIIFLTIALLFCGFSFFKNEERESYTINKSLILEKTANGYLEKYQDPRTDFLFLLESQQTTCLQLMKELRNIDKKYAYPHSKWRLLEVVDEFNIIFEAAYPSYGSSPTCYKLHRLQKKGDRFYLVTIELKNSPHSESSLSYLIDKIKKENIT